MSTQVINGKIISNYPVFEGSQVLTSEQLNGLFTYLDQQHRFTRSRLIGMGIVCGMHVRTVGNEVHLSEGIGITSDGFLVKMSDCTMAYRRDYFLPSNVVYEPFGDFDEDRIFSQFEDVELFELLSNIPESGGYQEIDPSFLENKYLLIFLECFDRDPRSCLGKNCEDLGKERIFTTRKIAVDKSGLDKILDEIENDDRWSDAVVENPYHSPTDLDYLTLKKPLFHPEGDESTGYEDFVLNYVNQLYGTNTSPGLFRTLFGNGSDPGLLAQTYEQYQSILEPVYDYTNPFIGNTPVNTKRNELSAFLGGSDSRDYLGIQSVYDYFDLLVKAYNEFVSTGEEFISQCCPKKYFPLHLMVGKITAGPSKESDEWDAIRRSRYRHQFLQPEILNSQKHLLNQLISLHKRLVLMVESFDMNKLADTETIEVVTKITPTWEGPVGEQSIPAYFDPEQNGSVYGVTETTLEREWNYDNTIKSRKNDSEVRVVQAFSYERNRITPTNLTPSNDNLIQAPLAFHLDQNRLRIEGLLNKNSMDLKQDLLTVRDHFNLPFEVLNLKIENETTGITVESHYWQDLQSDYQAIKNANIATFKTLGGDLKAFAREVESWDYAMADANVSNFQTEIEQVLLDISDADALCDTVDAIASNFPTYIEDLHIGSDTSQQFPAILIMYKEFRRALSRTLLVIQYADNILVQEKIAVIPPRVFNLWSKPLRRIAESINDFLTNNDFYQLQNLYERFKVRYDYLQSNHYSVFSNFIKLHPGIERRPVRNGGTQLLVYQDPDNSNDGSVFADFTLPYRLDSDKIEIPVDPVINETKLPPLGRGEAVLLLEGQDWLIDVTANDLDPNGNPLRVDEKGHVDGGGAFQSGKSFLGADVKFHEGQTTLLRYGPLAATGSDYFQYTIENTTETDLKDISYVEILVVAPYLEHVKAVDDLAATDSHHSVVIEVLANDTKYDDTELIIPSQSAFGAPLTLSTDSKKILYAPIYGREGRDTFNYTIRHNRGTTTDPIYESSEAQVEVIVFCCDKLEIELICEGNDGTFDVMTEREKAESARLDLLDEGGNPVDVITTPNSEIRVVDPSGEEGGPSVDFENPYLWYQPNKLFTGQEEFTYEITDGEGFVRRVRLQIQVTKCGETRFERTLKDTPSDFVILREGESALTVFENRDDLTDSLTTEHGSVTVVTVAEVKVLRYTPDSGYYGWDQLQYAYLSADGVMRYNTLQILIDGYEKVRVESTFQDTNINYLVLDDTMLDAGYRLIVYQDKSSIDPVNLTPDTIATDQDGIASVDEGEIRFEPKAGFIGDDSFTYAVILNDEVFEYGKFYVIIDTNRTVRVEYTLRDQTKNISVLSDDQISQGAELTIVSEPSVPGATAEVIVNDGEDYIRYTPQTGYVGQDSFTYQVKVGDLVLFGTIYMVIDSNERIEVETVFKNTFSDFRLFDGDQTINNLEITSGTTNGTATVSTDQRVIRYTPNNDYLGQDKLKYKAELQDSVQYGTVFFIVTCDCRDISVMGVVTDEVSGEALVGVKVKEVGTTTEDITGPTGFYNISVSPTAQLEFSKHTHERKTIDVSYRSTVNVELTRKIVRVEGQVVDVSGSGIANASVVSSLGSTITDASGNYGIDSYVDELMTYSATGYSTEVRSTPAEDTSDFNVTLTETIVEVFITVSVKRPDGTVGRRIVGAEVLEVGTDNSVSTASTQVLISVNYASQLEVTAIGFETALLDVNRLPGAADGQVNIDVPLNPASVEVIGKVTDAANPGQAIVGATVGFGDFGPSQTVQTVEKGDYVIRMPLFEGLRARFEGYQDSPVQLIVPSSATVIDINELFNEQEQATIDFQLIPLEGAEPFDLEGRVIDEEGQPLPGTNVLVVGTTRGATTDLDGIFRIQVVIGDELDVSLVGFQSERIRIVNSEPMTINLTRG